MIAVDGAIVAANASRIRGAGTEPTPEHRVLDLG